MNNNVNCPLCGNPMIYITEKAFYRCIDGCGEFWPTPEYELYKNLFDQEIHYKKSMLKKQGRCGNSQPSGRVLRNVDLRRTRQAGQGEVIACQNLTIGEVEA